ncbi:hypothetical protein PPYR_08510 [Photinus pyralis]|uniref:Lipid-binding serum glycoprotein N-terminal domain-containing protein n=2 Tax=Photinus pyralis TaxID=7054 RepID=A0A5N4AJL7_PHOPY|nr:uncharacterized protein LOC116171644 [Photinus pyralis]KAB0797517.1 hypothetical protein PPYR_08510 [Photinus pyralis]
MLVMYERYPIMVQQVLTVLTFTLFFCTGNSQLPSDVQKCSITDDDCLKTTIQTVLRHLQNDPSVFHVASVQPMRLSQGVVPAGQVWTFDQYYHDVEMYNHAMSTVTHVESSITNNTLTFAINISNPDVVFKTDYEYKNAFFDGFNVTSKGKVIHHHEGYVGVVQITGDIEGEGDTKHVTITDVAVSFVTSKLTFDYNTADPQFDAWLGKLFADNMESIFNDMKGAYGDFYAYAYNTIIITPIFTTFSYNDLFL